MQIIIESQNETQSNILDQSALEKDISVNSRAIPKDSLYRGSPVKEGSLKKRFSDSAGSSGKIDEDHRRKLQLNWRRQVNNERVSAS